MTVGERERETQHERERQRSENGCVQKNKQCKNTEWTYCPHFPLPANNTRTFIHFSSPPFLPSSHLICLSEKIVVSPSLYKSHCRFTHPISCCWIVSLFIMVCWFFCVFCLLNHLILLARNRAKNNCWFTSYLRHVS